MQLSPEVNRKKYERELSRLGDQRVVLEQRGIHLLSSSVFPIVELLFVPSHPLRIPLPPPPGMNIAPNAQYGVDLWGFSMRAFKAHFDLSDYDLRAPSLEFRDAWSDKLLPVGQIAAMEFDKERQGYSVLLPDHPNTHRPFLCMRGIREYHEHPQHTGDDWLLHRNTTTLFSTVLLLWRVTIDLIRPQLAFSPNGLNITLGCEAKL